MLSIFGATISVTLGIFVSMVIIIMVLWCIAVLVSEYNVSGGRGPSREFRAQQQAERAARRELLKRYNGNLWLFFVVLLGVLWLLPVVVGLFTRS
jgi:ABC-type Fe3+ transport system permease subunit